MPGDGLQPSFLSLPARTTQPRRSGVTHVLDKGLSTAELGSLLDNVGPSIDIVKFGWGTAYVSGSIADKSRLCRALGILTCVGGTLLEIAEVQRRIRELVVWMRRLGIDCVEVSNGALGMSAERKRALVRDLSQEFCVLSEVGSKSPVAPLMDQWTEEMLADLEAGASWVVAEGRESGTVGLYDAAGAVRTELVDAILAAVGPERVIFEAPRRQQQAWLIRRAGTNVNLGNIASSEVVSVETLRLGLRADTIELATRTPTAVRDDASGLVERAGRLGA